MKSFVQARHLNGAQVDLPLRPHDKTSAPHLTRTKIPYVEPHVEQRRHAKLSDRHVNGKPINPPHHIFYDESDNTGDIIEGRNHRGQLYFLIHSHDDNKQRWVDIDTLLGDNQEHAQYNVLKNWCDDQAQNCEPASYPQ